MTGAESLYVQFGLVYLLDWNAGPDVLEYQAYA